jgi:hypothetical protein
MTSWYCPLPFRHAFIDSTGVGACCQTPRYQTDLDTWHSHPKLKQLQQTILDGNVPTECQGCTRQENTQGRSLRTDSLRDYNNEIFTDTKITFIDYRSKNICNFQCRSCNPTFSHKIDNEVKRHPELSKFHQMNSTKTVSVSDVNSEWIVNHLGQIDRLMLTGGEPTVIPEVKTILEEVLKNHADRIQVLITTNASFQDSFWYELTEKLKNLHWTVSIDAVGSAAEIVRYGTDWAQVSHNISWLSHNAASLDINTVVSNLNLFQLGPLLQLCRELQIKSISPNGRHGNIGCRHQFHISQRPYMLSADNLTPELKIQAVDYLIKCSEFDLDTEQKNMLQGLLNMIKQSEFDPSLWARGQQYNQILDRVRNQDHTVLFKEYT